MKKTINTNLIYKAIKELSLLANLHLSKDVYEAIYDAYTQEKNVRAKNILHQILLNAKLANDFKRPLCQDTGLVVVFLEIGQDVILEGDLLDVSINKAVSESYQENYFRKSLVNHPCSKRENTKDNTPAVIHSQIVSGNEIKISISIKGGGSENMSALKMLKPLDGEEGIIDFVIETVKNAAVNACPPIRLGIGIGGSMEQAAILAKKALLEKITSLEELKSKSDDISQLSAQILEKVNKLEIGPMGTGGSFTCYGVNALSFPSHIASLPVAININCHSSRHASCVISENDIKYNTNDFEYDFADILETKSEIKEVKLDDISALQSLKKGNEVYLTGTVYTARDAAHKKLVEMIKNKQPLPFDLKNQTIFYAGPCPAQPNEIIGPTGPTSSTRMTKFAPVLYENGILSTIGKGEVTPEVVDSIKKNKGLYFSATGGIAVLLASKIKKSEIIAFPELGPEAIYKLKLDKFPVVVEVDCF